MSPEPHATSEYWSKGPVILLALRLLVLEAHGERARIEGQAKVYPGSTGMRLLLGTGILIFAWTLLFQTRQEETWVYVMCSGIVLLTALAWPSSIWLTDVGIEERRWWRPKKFIPWSEVTSIQVNHAGDRAVFGKSVQSICLDRFHVDPFGFETEVRRRANLKETLDASAPITLGLEERVPIRSGLFGRHRSTRRERKSSRT